MKNKKVIIAALLSLILIFTVAVSSTRAVGAFVQSNVADELTTVSLTGVTAGNLIVLWVKWEGTTTGGATVSDGTTSLTMGTLSDPGDNTVGQFAYLLSANGGNKTYTVTFPTGATFPRLRIAEFSYSGTISLDAQNIGSGDSAAPASGNITTTGTDEIVLGGFSESALVTLSSPLINASAATFVVGGVHTKMWYRIVTSTFTGNASATSDTSSFWVSNVIAFKIASASGAVTKAKVIINGAKVFINGSKMIVN